MSTDPRKRITLREREETILKWLDSRGGGFHRNAHNKFDVQDTLAEYWKGLFPDARHGAHEVNKTLRRVEEKGLIEVERDKAGTPVEVVDIRVKQPRAEPVDADEIELVERADIDALEAMLDHIDRHIAGNHSANADAWKAVREREAQVSKILTDMTQAATRRHEAVIGKFEMLHAALSGDRDLRQNYSARLGLLERNVGKLLQHFNIRSSD